MIWDLLIIGGGAAGLFAAVCAKKENKNLNIVILERLDRVGKKLALTGNGRCNITNRCLEQKRYHGRAPQFIKTAFERFTLADTENFFEKLGTPIVYEGDKGYPASLQAASVTDALRFACDESGVITSCGHRVTDIKKKGDLFTVITDKGDFRAHAVIAAGGMLSGGEKLGCDGSLYGIIKRMGVSAVAPSPAIVQLKTDTEFVRQLKGIKVDATASVYGKNGGCARRESGEVLFCDYGLSGPPILQLSGSCNEGDSISLDLMPNVDEGALCEVLTTRISLLSKRNVDEFLSGLMNKRLGQVVMKRAGFKLSDAVSSLDVSDAAKIAAQIKNFTLKINGNTGFINSQVTAGGLSTDEFYPDTLMCKKISGLFAAGEILDIDGDCGGFNLQWAWSSGFCAAFGAIQYLKGKKK